MRGYTKPSVAARIKESSGDKLYVRFRPCEVVRLRVSGSCWEHQELHIRQSPLSQPAGRQSHSERKGGSYESLGDTRRLSASTAASEDQGSVHHRTVAQALGEVVHAISPTITISQFRRLQARKILTSTSAIMAKKRRTLVAEECSTLRDN